MLTCLQVVVIAGYAITCGMQIPVIILNFFLAGDQHDKHCPNDTDQQGPPFNRSQLGLPQHLHHKHHLPNITRAGEGIMDETTEVGMTPNDDVCKMIHFSKDISEVLCIHNESSTISEERHCKVAFQKRCRDKRLFRVIESKGIVVTNATLCCMKDSHVAKQHDGDLANLPQSRERRNAPMPLDSVSQFKSKMNIESATNISGNSTSKLSSAKDTQMNFKEWRKASPSAFVGRVERDLEHNVGRSNDTSLPETKTYDLADLENVPKYVDPQGLERLSGRFERNRSKYEDRIDDPNKLHNTSSNVGKLSELATDLETGRLPGNLWSVFQGEKTEGGWTDWTARDGVDHEVEDAEKINELSGHEPGTLARDKDCDFGSFLPFAGVIVNVILLFCLFANGAVAITFYLRANLRVSYCATTTVSGVLGVLSLLTWSRVTYWQFEHTWQFWPSVASYFYGLLVYIPVGTREVYLSARTCMRRDNDDPEQGGNQDNDDESYGGRGEERNAHRPHRVVESRPGLRYTTGVDAKDAENNDGRNVTNIPVTAASVAHDKGTFTPRSVSTAKEDGADQKDMDETTPLLHPTTPQAPPKHQSTPYHSECPVDGRKIELSSNGVHKTP